MAALEKKLARLPDVARNQDAVEMTEGDFQDFLAAMARGERSHGIDPAAWFPFVVESEKQIPSNTESQ
jgi:hypothetical protein